MIIYKATNQINGKIYIGQTVNSLNRRKIVHRSQSNRPNNYFHNAIRKYGIDCFYWQVICICPDLDSLNEREQYYIAFYDLMNRDIGYNMKEGGFNYLLSDEIKKKISETKKGQKGHKHTAETIEQMRKSKLGKNNPAYGKPMSDEQKNKIRNSTIGNKNHFYGKHHSIEAKNKISQLHLGRKLTEEHKRKIGEAGLGRKHSAESIQKMSKVKKEYWKNKRGELR